MFEYLKKERWSPFVVGALLAALSILSYFLTGHMLGSSTSFVRIAGALLHAIMPEYVRTNAYYLSHLSNNYWINWQIALLIGVFIGAYIAARLAGPITYSDVPPLWEQRFGSSKTKRYIGAFLGGVIILFGARLAGGCTSGHAVTGGMQLAAAGWVFMIGLFATGVPTAFLLYSNKGK